MSTSIYEQGPYETPEDFLQESVDFIKHISDADFRLLELNRTGEDKKVDDLKLLDDVISAHEGVFTMEFGAYGADYVDLVRELSKYDPPLSVPAIMNDFLTGTYNIVLRDPNKFPKIKNDLVTRIGETKYPIPVWLSLDQNSDPSSEALAIEKAILSEKVYEHSLDPEEKPDYKGIAQRLTDQEVLDLERLTISTTGKIARVIGADVPPVSRQEAALNLEPIVQEIRMLAALKLEGASDDMLEGSTRFVTQFVKELTIDKCKEVLRIEALQTEVDGEQATIDNTSEPIASPKLDIVAAEDQEFPAQPVARRTFRFQSSAVLSGMHAPAGRIVGDGLTTTIEWIRINDKKGS